MRAFVEIPFMSLQPADGSGKCFLQPLLVVPLGHVG
jgi:hypothetical protein